MSTRRLFLLGGPGAMEPAAEAFVPAAGGPETNIALLLQGGPGSVAHVGEYTAPWLRRGATRYQVVMPADDGSLDVDAALAAIGAATGIMIGGGDTPTYHRLYATGPLAEAIRERYRQGVPVAGMSAGALIAPEICAIPPEDTGEPAVRIVAGLGLISGIVVGVHFSEWGALPAMLEAMVATHTFTGWGLDEGTCALFEDGRFCRALGRPAHEITMTDFERATHTAAVRV